MTPVGPPCSPSHTPRLHAAVQGHGRCSRSHCFARTHGAHRRCVHTRGSGSSPARPRRRAAVPVPWQCRHAAAMPAMRARARARAAQVKPTRARALGWPPSPPHACHARCCMMRARACALAGAQQCAKLRHHARRRSEQQPSTRRPLANQRSRARAPPFAFVALTCGARSSGCRHGLGRLVPHWRAGTWRGLANSGLRKGCHRDSHHLWANGRDSPIRLTNSFGNVRLAVASVATEQPNTVLGRIVSIPLAGGGGHQITTNCQLQTRIQIQ